MLLDESIWREVRNTCGTESRIDYTTGTISVDVSVICCIDTFINVFLVKILR